MAREMHKSASCVDRFLWGELTKKPLNAKRQAYKAHLAHEGENTRTHTETKREKEEEEGKWWCVGSECWLHDAMRTKWTACTPAHTHTAAVSRQNLALEDATTNQWVESGSDETVFWREFLTH